MNITFQDEGPGGSKSYVVALPNNSYKPITNTSTTKGHEILLKVAISTKNQSIRNITNWLQVNHISHKVVVISIWKFVTYKQRHFEILNVSFTTSFEIKLLRPTLEHELTNPFLTLEWKCVGGRERGGGIKAQFAVMLAMKTGAQDHPIWFYSKMILQEKTDLVMNVLKWSWNTAF